MVARVNDHIFECIRLSHTGANFELAGDVCKRIGPPRVLEKLGQTPLLL
jgi:hypothetical protein